MSASIGAHAQTPGNPDPGFTAVTGSIFHLAVQPGGQIVYNTAAAPLNTAFPSGESPPLRLNANGTPDAGFSPATGTSVFLATQPDGKILTTSGQYGFFGGTIIGDLFRLNPDGSLDGGFTYRRANTSSDAALITNVAVQSDGQIVLSRYFDFGGYDASGIDIVSLIRLSADGSMGSDSLESFRSYGPLHNIVVQPDGKVFILGRILGGTENIDSYGSRYIYLLLRLNADGTQDNSFNYGTPDSRFIYGGDNATDAVGCMAVQPDGKILVGLSTYTTAKNAASDARTRAVRRLNTDGSVDPSFSATTDLAGTINPTLGSYSSSAVNALILQPDGKVIIGGRFDQVDGVAGHNLARLNADGSLDTSFTSNDAAGTVNALTLQPDGKLLVGGSNGLARLYAYTPAAIGAATVSGMVGQPFAYRIAAGNAPAGYATGPLPAGLSLNAATGVISGTPTLPGTFNVTVSTLNTGGVDTATGLLTLSIAPGVPVATLAATMPTVAAGSGGVAEFTLSLSPAPASDVMVSFKVTGTAANGADYVLLKASKKIKAGQTGKPIKVAPLGNGGGAGVQRTVVFTLQPGAGYTVGTTGKVKVRIRGQ